MNYQNFNQGGGFPIKTQTLDEMQTAYSVFNAFGELSGNFSIISGCEIVGTTVSNGTVFINGELLEFRGGKIGLNVIITELNGIREFKNGSQKDVVFTRFASFGIGSVQFPWANFKRGFKTIAIQPALDLKEDKTTITALINRIVALEARPNASVPAGLIAIWDRPAADIPDGWIEYLPLRGKTPIGLDPNYVQGTDLIDYKLEILGYTAGVRQHKLTKNEMPNYDLNRGVGNETVQPGYAIIRSNTGGNSYTETINSGGGDLAHTNMSPYRIVNFIKKT